MKSCVGSRKGREDRSQVCLGLIVSEAGQGKGPTERGRGRPWICGGVVSSSIYRTLRYRG